MVVTVDVGPRIPKGQSTEFGAVGACYLPVDGAVRIESRGAFRTGRPRCRQAIAQPADVSTPADEDVMSIAADRYRSAFINAPL